MKKNMTAFSYILSGSYICLHCSLLYVSLLPVNAAPILLYTFYTVSMLGSLHMYLTSASLLRDEVGSLSHCCTHSEKEVLSPLYRRKKSPSLNALHSATFSRLFFLSLPHLPLLEEEDVYLEGCSGIYSTLSAFHIWSSYGKYALYMKEELEEVYIKH
jgi:hypothetical protein